MSPMASSSMFMYLALSLSDSGSSSISSESEEMLGAEQYYHVILSLVIVEGSEKLYLMSHFECNKKN